jgi:hypothetical protein
MVAINVFFIVIFILSAALQYNDPDPYIWVPLYLYGALLCWLAIKKIYKKALFLTGIVVYAVYAAYLLFDSDGVINWISEHNAENIVQSMKATKPWIEETREFFGLLILLFALVMNMVWLSKTKSREKKNNAQHLII